MIDGKIRILGKPHIMLPTNLVAVLDKNSDLQQEAVKRIFRKEMSYYAKKLGSREEGMLKNVEDVFEIFGLGKLEIVSIDYKKRASIIRVHNSSLNHKNMITPAILSGMFSFLLRREVSAKHVDGSSIGADYSEYDIR